MAQYLREYRSTSCVAFADALKEVCCELLNLHDIPVHRYSFDDEAKDNIVCVEDVTIRQYLQRVGTLMREKVDSDVWASAVVRKLQEIEERGAQLVCVTDLRYENERDVLLRAGFECVTVQLVRPSTGTDNHESENQTFAVDHVVQNTGTVGELLSSIDRIVRVFLLA